MDPIIIPLLIVVAVLSACILVVFIVSICFCPICCGCLFCLCSTGAVYSTRLHHSIYFGMVPVDFTEMWD